MADEPIDDEDDVLDLTDEEPEDAELDNEDGDEGEDDGPARVVIGDEPEEIAETDNKVIRQMRQELREAKRELAAARKPAATIEIGDKPTLESCGYDADEFETKLDEWKDRKTLADRQVTAQQEETRQVNEAWQADLASYEAKKAKLGFDDYDDAEDTAKSTLDMVQQAVVVKSANDPALFLYALAKSPAKLEELAKIKDPIKMAAAVARMEGTVKIMKGRKAPAPDRPTSGSASMGGTSDQKLEKLQREADKTGDRTALIAYKSKLAKK